MSRFYPSRAKVELSSTDPERWLTCPACGKRSYPSRKIARGVARRLDRGFEGQAAQAYGCRSGDVGGPTRWHVGHPSSQRLRRDLNAVPWAPACPTECLVRGCDAACHEGHRPWALRGHQPGGCPAVRWARDGVAGGDEMIGEERS